MTCDAPTPLLRHTYTTKLVVGELIAEVTQADVAADAVDASVLTLVT